jgi:hypothetical protein
LVISPCFDIAGYDKEKKAAYIEYANGDRKYAE